MIISKLETKLMALILTAVMVLSGFIYSPKTASADEPTTKAADNSAPKVEVLGATLRLNESDNKDEKQSIRIAIQVSNASKAKACGITLTVNGKDITIGTEHFPGTTYKSNYVNSKSAEFDAVVYAVVITNIPKDNFDTDIKVKGTAIGMDDEEVHSEGTVKSVTNVVKAIQKRYPELNLELKYGYIVSLFRSLKIGDNIVKKKDTEGQDNFEYWVEDANDDSKGTAICKKSADNTYYTITTSTSKKGLGYQFGVIDGPFDYLYVASLKSTTGNNVDVGMTNWYSSTATKDSVSTLSNEWQTIKFKITCNSWQGDFFSTADAGQQYDIRQFDIYKILSQKDFDDYSDTIEPELPAGQSRELIVNGDFNDGTNGWGSNNNNNVSVVQEDGNNYLKNAGRWNDYSGPKTNTISGDFKKGDILNFTYKIKRAAACDNPLAIKIKYLNGEKTDQEVYMTNGAAANTDSWTTVTGEYTIEADADSVEFYIMGLHWSTHTEDIYIDDVSVIQYRPDPADFTPVDLSTYTIDRTNNEAGYNSSTGYVTITTDTGQEYGFDLPISIKKGDRVTIKVTGTYEGNRGVRTYIKHGTPNTSSTEFIIPDNQNHNGDFSKEVIATIENETTNTERIYIKGPAPGTALDGTLVIKSIGVRVNE